MLQHHPQERDVIIAVVSSLFVLTIIYHDLSMKALLYCMHFPNTLGDVSTSRVQFADIRISLYECIARTSRPKSN
jgi:hypothetical protein